MTYGCVIECNGDNQWTLASMQLDLIINKTLSLVYLEDPYYTFHYLFKTLFRPCWDLCLSVFRKVIRLHHWKLLLDLHLYYKFVNSEILYKLLWVRLSVWEECMDHVSILLQWVAWINQGLFVVNLSTCVDLKGRAYLPLNNLLYNAGHRCLSYWCSRRFAAIVCLFLCRGSLARRRIKRYAMVTDFSVIGVLTFRTGNVHKYSQR